MPVRKNGYYADPALGTAFDNLAEVFATPSGADLAGYANASATREKAARLADLYNYASDPNYNADIADRRGIAAGQYTPIQSFFAQGQNDATTRRNADVVAKTSVDVAGVNNKGLFDRQVALPIHTAAGEITTLPAQLQTATGLPGTISGAFKTAPGETITRDGVTLASGAPKPLSDSEVKGAILGRLPENEQRAVALQGVGVSPTVGKDGEPINVLTPDAAGKAPYVQDTRQPQIANYKTPDGKIGTSMLDKDTGKWKDTQTGAELPPGSQTYTANLQGDKDATGLGAGTKNNIDSMLVDLSLAQDTSKQLRGILTKNPGVQGLVGHLRGTVQDVIQTGNEVGQLLNVNMEKMKKDIAEGRVDPEIAKKFANFDPNIPATNMLETLLTAQVAKILDPNGRVSNDRYEQVSKAIGSGGMLGNSARTMATLDQLDKIIESRRSILAPSSPTAAKIGQAPAASATAAAPGATPAIRTWNPATGALE